MSLMKPNFEKDVVYLVQFPRPTTAPNLSPFCIKLETWLRMMEIKYEHVGNDFTKMSKKGQVPYIELNGEQFADSNLIIGELTQRFGKKSLDEHLTEQERAQGTALHALIEDKIFWNGFGFLAPSGKPMLEANGILKDVPFLLKPIVVWQTSRYFANRAYYHGIGRHSLPEIAEFAKKDLKALSVLLGNKPYFLGDKPTNLDSTAFGHLASAYFQKNPLKEVGEVFEFMNKECANLVAFLKRMITKYYPDWKEIAPESKEI